MHQLGKTAASPTRWIHASISRFSPLVRNEAFCLVNVRTDGIIDNVSIDQKRLRMMNPVVNEVGYGVRSNKANIIIELHINRIIINIVLVVLPNPFGESLLAQNFPPFNFKKVRVLLSQRHYVGTIILVRCVRPEIMLRNVFTVPEQVRHQNFKVLLPAGWGNGYGFL